MSQSQEEDVKSSAAIRLVIGGDVCPINANEGPCVRGDAEAVFRDLLPVMRGADLCVVNLECPLIDTPAPMAKIGPVIGARRAAAAVLPAAGVHAVTLANNHIMDHGPSGLAATSQVCREHGVAHFGAGPDLKSAQRIHVQQVGGLRVGLLGVTHHEFSIAGRTTPGAAPMDALEVHRQLRSQEGPWDLLVALVHAGPSMHPLPTPRLQRYCRFLVEIGASVVVCQHSHCVGALEHYSGSLIVYGQGNFVFDWRPEPGPEWFQGFLVEVTLSGAGVVGHRLYPYGRGSSGVGVEALREGDARQLIREIETRSAVASDPARLEAQWREYCAKRANSYYQQILGDLPGTGLLRRAADRLGIRFAPLRARHRMALLNLVRCEGHREALETILDDSGKTRADTPAKR